MKIGELAKSTQTQVETIRYYEREGLLPTTVRSEGNYRIYGPDHAARLSFIRNCRSLDMTLNEIRTLLTFKDAPQGALYTPFEETLAHSDVLTLHCPLNAATKNMIGRTEFSLMKKRPLLINTARGGLVDETAVEEALDQGWISGAAFDVVTVEPPPPRPPLHEVDRSTQFHPDASCGLGESRSHSGTGESVG